MLFCKYIYIYSSELLNQYGKSNKAYKKNNNLNIGNGSSTSERNCQDAEMKGITLILK